MNTPNRVRLDLISSTAQLIGMDVDEYRTAKALQAAFGEADFTVYVSAVTSMARGYVDALCWTQRAYDDDNADADLTLSDLGYGYDDLHPGTRARIIGELVALITAHPLAVRMYGANRRYSGCKGDAWSHFGHDYLLTRDGHGAGFWDRGLGDLGDYLTDIAKTMGEHDELSRDFDDPDNRLTDGETPR
ncbi:hypothetical protein SEA_SKYSAND_91 [Gordonia phage Skysand]|uniref:Uncharacterized protein n=1 Tax=Gordonia phage Skysand TaxID=2301559 RepID=A0A385DRV7_9CAUD|nr:hypothetical protein KNU08_gp91 [Gordonia phage Skysand]AXQ62124.1 hypothetical protein SEA_SKYSAND_91 [Gordonia phage Skysand]